MLVVDFITKARQFFEGENGVLSMTRLLCFLSFFPASLIAMRLCTETSLSIYVGCYALSYLGGKLSDAVLMNQAKKNADSPSA